MYEQQLQEAAERLFIESARSNELTFEDFQEAEIARLRSCCKEEGETGPEFSNVRHLVSIDYLTFDDLTDESKEGFWQAAIDEENERRDMEETYRELDRWVTHG